jgi:hypothetical protein
VVGMARRGIAGVYGGARRPETPTTRAG